VLLGATAAAVAAGTIAAPPAVHAIVGGAPVASLAETAPWMVTVLASYPNGSTAGCGGTLVAPGWVLTASHCVDRHAQGVDASSIEVVAGGLEIVPEPGEQARHVEAVQFHPHYADDRTGIDVALLRLERPFDLGPSVQPISLVPRGTDLRGAEVEHLGWGGGATHLRAATTRVSLQPCRYDFWLCTARATGQSGDSGGPLVWRRDGHPPVLVGVTMQAVIFGNVAAPVVHDWIVGHIGAAPSAPEPVPEPPTAPAAPVPEPHPDRTFVPVVALAASSSVEWNGWGLAGVADGGSTGLHGFHSMYGLDPAATQWVSVDLGATRTIDLVRLDAADHMGNPRFGFPDAYVVQVSDDPTFTTATTVATGGGAPAAGVVDVPVPHVAARYVRVVATTLGTTAHGVRAFVLEEIGVRAL